MDKSFTLKTDNPSFMLDNLKSAELLRDVLNAWIAYQRLPEGA
jgi:hypothetical protein